MNTQLHHTVAFTRMADELRAAERRRRFGVGVGRRERRRGRREGRPRLRFRRRFA